ncbi:MAG: hypothetical protein ACLR1G_15280 [Alistipes indistinctus]
MWCVTGITTGSILRGRCWTTWSWSITRRSIILWSEANIWWM